MQFSRAILVLLMLAIGQHAVSGPGAETQLIPVGGRIPDTTFSGMLHFNQESVKLSEFSGKLVLLEFWGTNCAPCVGGMPKLMQLQEQFGNRIQILLLTLQPREMLQEFFANRPHLRIPLSASGPEAFRALARPLGVPGLGTFAWIDAKDGTVRAVTTGAAVTAENIEAMLSGRAVKLPTPAGYGIPKPFDAQRPYLLAGNGDDGSAVQYHSLLTGTRAGNPGTPGFVPSGPYAGRRAFFPNASIDALFRNVFGSSAPGDASTAFVDAWPSRRVVIEAIDAERIKDRAYCYELLVPPAMAPRIRQVMLQDLRRLFHVDAGVESREVPALVMVRRGAAARKPVDQWPGWWSVGGPFGEGKLLPDVNSFYTLQRRLESLLVKPVIDETGLKGVVDLAVKDEYELKDIDVVRRALAPYGIELIAENRKVDLLVIRDMPESAAEALDHPRLAASRAPLSQGSAADPAWLELMSMSRSFPPEEAQDVAVFYAWEEMRRRAFWQEGLRFFERFPEDPRRWKWIPGALMDNPRFWKDVEQGGKAAADMLAAQGWVAARLNDAGVEVDDALKSGWRAQYIELRRKALESSAISKDDRDAILSYDSKFKPDSTAIALKPVNSP